MSESKKSTTFKSAPKVKAEVKVSAPKYAKDIGVLKLRKVGVDAITGKPTNKPFNCTYNTREWNNLFKIASPTVRGGEVIMIFGNCIVLEEIQTPEGAKSIAEFAKEIEAKYSDKA